MLQQDTYLKLEHQLHTEPSPLNTEYFTHNSLEFKMVHKQTNKQEENVQTGLSRQGGYGTSNNHSIQK